MIEEQQLEETGGRVTLRLGEAAAALGICEKTLTRWADGGLVPHRRVGRMRLFAIEDLRDFARGGKEQ